MAKWEYKTVAFETKGTWGGSLDVSLFDEELNKNGKSGWEMVSCFVTQQTQGVTKAVFAVFKREIEER